MNVQKRIKRKDETTSILDLPTEVIEYICSIDALDMNDVFNLAVAHSKLNECLFGEPNPFLWKSKYVQRYGKLDKEEYEIVIDEQNTWKEEIMLRTRLEKAVAAEISQMPSMYMKFKNVPYHMYPFSESLNSTNESHRYYILHASVTYYKHLLNNKNFKENYDLLYTAHHFLIYSCQVYFGYKIVDFLSLPPSKQTVERGFYLLGRWWCPTDSTPYRDICKHLDNIAMTVCQYIQSKNPLHPLVGLESCLERVSERGKINLDHDLFDEISTCFILNCLREVVFSKSEMVCNCNHDINCFLLQPVMEYQKGSLFLLCVMYEAIARRLGVNVKLTATSVHKFVSWSSSWPKNKLKEPTCYVIDIASGGDMREATVCPVSRKLPERYNGNSLHDLFSTFCTTVEGIAYNDLSVLKYVLDFQKLFKADDANVEFKCQKFHEYHDYCRCPLLKDASNPRAPNHENERNILYPFWEEVFPLTPKIRGSCFDTSYSVGMVVNIGTHIKDSRVFYGKRGIIVGWTRVPMERPMYHEQHTYYVIISYKASDNAVWKYLSPNIEVVQPHDEMQRQLKPIAEDFNIIGKFFKYYSHELCAFVPIDELARLYPDDLSFAKMNIKTPITKIYSS